MTNECVFCGEAIKAKDKAIMCNDRRTNEKCASHDDCWWHYDGYRTHERVKGAGK